MAYPQPKIELIKDNVIRVYHPDLLQPKTYLTAAVAAAGVTLTVADNAGYSNTDPQELLLLEGYGVETAEVTRINGAVAAGTSLTVQATVFAHAIDTRVSKILFNRIEIRGGTTAAIAASASGTIVTFAGANDVLINVSGEYTDFVVVGTTFAFYSARFYNSLATTVYYSAFSDGIAATDFTVNTIGFIRRNAFKNIGEEFGPPKWTADWVYDQIYLGELDIAKELKRWSWLYMYDFSLGGLSAGQRRIALPADIEDDRTTKSILGIRVEDDYNLDPIDFTEYQDLTQGTTYTEVRTTTAIGATSLPVDNSRDFTDTGTVSRGLVGYWKFDENTGTTAFDSTLNANNGAITGATYVAGNSGRALDFDGADDIVTVTDAAMIQNVFDGGGALSVWINPDNDGEGDLGRVIEKDGVWNLRTASQSGTNVELVFEYGFSTTGGVWSTAVNIPVDSWTHVLIVYNNDAVINDPVIYINGSSVTVTEDTAPVGTRTTDAATNLIIGNNAATTRTFDGTIDEVRLYSRALSSTEASTLNSNPGGSTKTVDIYQDGQVYVINYTDIVYSSTAGGLLGIPFSGTNSITANLDVDSAIWQDMDVGTPLRYTVNDGFAYFDVPPSTDFNGKDVWCDYYATVSRKDSDGDGISVNDPQLLISWLEMAIKKEKANGVLAIDDISVIEYNRRKHKLIQNEITGTNLRMVVATPAGRVRRRGFWW